MQSLAQESLVCWMVFISIECSTKKNECYFIKSSAEKESTESQYMRSGRRMFVKIHAMVNVNNINNNISMYFNEKATWK